MLKPTIKLNKNCKRYFVQHMHGNAIIWFISYCRGWNQSQPPRVLASTNQQPALVFARPPTVSNAPPNPYPDARGPNGVPNKYPPAGSYAPYGATSTDYQSLPTFGDK